MGGDFYQHLLRADGSLLLVVGDVSGKGIEAAMVAATVMGALRTLSDLQPGALLTSLNRAVSGKARGGFVTCCCALFKPDGQVIAANAGHLAPYGAGIELTIETGLPLGLTSDAEYLETEVRLGAGEQMTVVSDGVVEAAAAQGELFGFERTREISSQAALKIAEAARQWG